MLSVLQAKEPKVHGDDYVIGWELFTKRAIRKGNWKIIYEPFHEVLEPRVAGIKTDAWQLYNLAEDPSELNDLSEINPEILEEMISYWQEYVTETNLIIPDSWNGY